MQDVFGIAVLEIGLSCLVTEEGIDMASCCGQQEVIIHKNDNMDIRLTVQTVSMTPFDLTGYLVKLQVREQYESTSALITKTSATATEIEILTPLTNGVALVHFLPADTANLSRGYYVFDVQLSKNGKIYTVVDGSFLIVSDVTR